MKKALLFLFFIMASACAMAQSTGTGTFNKLTTKDSFRLGLLWVTSITNDSNLTTSSAKKLPTEQAIKKYITNYTWGRQGNTSSTSDFIGNNNNVSLRFRTNGVERMMMDSNGVLNVNGISNFKNWMHFNNGTGITWSNFPINAMPGRGTILGTDGYFTFYDEINGVSPISGLRGIYMQLYNSNRPEFIPDNPTYSSTMFNIEQLQVNSKIILGYSNGAASPPSNGIITSAYRTGGNTNIPSSNLTIQAGGGTGKSTLNGNIYFNTPDTVVGNTTPDSLAAQVQTPKAVITKYGSLMVGTTTEDLSAILNLSSTKKGFLMPRLSTAQRDAVSIPATGLTIYNTTTNEINFFNGTAWVRTYGNSIYLLNSDSVGITGFRSVGSANKTRDSLAAIIALKKNNSDSTALTGYTTINKNNRNISNGYVLNDSTLRFKTNDSTSIDIKFAQAAGIDSVTQSNDSIYQWSAGVKTFKFLMDRRTASVKFYQNFGSKIVAEPNGLTTSNLNTSNGMTSGQERFIALPLNTPEVLAGVSFNLQTQGVFNATGYNGVVLYSVSGNNLTVVASSTSDSMVFKNAVGWQAVPFTSTYTASPGNYVIGLIYNSASQSTAPTVGALSSVGINNQNAFFTNGAKVHGTINGVTSLPGNTTWGTVNSSVNNTYAALYKQ